MTSAPQPPPPAVIDFSAYWRPLSYADGIVVADALCWHAAPPEVVDEVGVPIEAVARGCSSAS